MNQLNVNLPELPYAVSEAMNRLRINIKFCGKNTRKILLTSCQPNEGKSTISSYLWKMLAEAGFPTVLVDVDLRKSVMKTRFQMDYDDDTTMGLNHYLSGMAEYEDVIYSTNIPNGYMVPCTQLLENPSALLEDVRFKELGSIFQHSILCSFVIKVISRTNCGLGPITLIVPPDVKVETTFFQRKFFSTTPSNYPQKQYKKRTSDLSEVPILRCFLKTLPLSTPLPASYQIPPNCTLNDISP